MDFKCVVKILILEVEAQLLELQNENIFVNKLIPAICLHLLFDNFLSICFLQKRTILDQIFIGFKQDIRY